MELPYRTNTAARYCSKQNAAALPPKDLLPDLPFDILCRITEHLPLQSFHALSLTCIRVHSALCGPFARAARRASKKELLQCLAVAVRDQPDDFVCQECCGIHGVDVRDTPHTGRATTARVCPKLEYLPLHSGPVHDSYQLHHHHVQLALKYSRLTSRT